MNKKEINNSIQRILKERTEIDFAYLFGSFIEEELYNDIDIGIFIKTEVFKTFAGSDFSYAIKLALQIEKVIKKSVDIIIMNNAPDHLIYYISKGKAIVNRDDNFRVDFITQAWTRYFDFKFQRNLYL
ncbi:nucleotidyltransferase domain-containing protein [bacterium]|nr:nucleotidyltransferase domain-containing protein [Candidatus Celaenobacter polaris]TSA27435.1 MAG: nucleotidyltransferase domain-containing protein [bacterium]